MDKLDTDLMMVLMENSRIPITRLAKKLNISREVATYRLNNLIKRGVIHDLFAQIDIARLGYIAAAFFVIVKTKRHKEFKEFIRDCPFVSWVAEWSGSWSFGMSIVGKTSEELDQRFLQIYDRFKEDIIDHKFTFHRDTYFFYEKYFQAAHDSRPKEVMKEYKIDKKDKIILKELSMNSRSDSVALSKKVSLSAPAVIQRIKRLEKSGHIEKYSIFVDVSKLGLYQYSIFVQNKDIHEKKKLVSFLVQHDKVCFMADYLGDPFLEFGLFVKDPYEVRKILFEIEEVFPDNKFTDIALLQEEFISTGPPPCIFE